MASQETPVWCWAASIQAILRHHGITATQSEIVEATYGVVGRLPAAGPNVYVKALNGMRIRGGVVELVRTSVARQWITSEELRDELNAGNPILLWYGTGLGTSHVVVLYRATFNADDVPITYTYWDPYPGVGVRTVAALEFQRVAQAFNLIRGVRVPLPIGPAATADSDAEPPNANRADERTSSDKDSEITVTPGPSTYSIEEWVHSAGVAASTGYTGFDHWLLEGTRAVSATKPRGADRCLLSALPRAASPNRWRTVQCNLLERASLDRANALLQKILPEIETGMRRLGWIAKPVDRSGEVGEVHHSWSDPNGDPRFGARVSAVITKWPDGYTVSIFARSAPRD
jgi:hypothetical protein